MYESSQICTEPAAAAELTGYLSTGHFINVFVSHNNITPLKYQEMRKEKNFKKRLDKTFVRIYNIRKANVCSHLNMINERTYYI